MAGSNDAASGASQGSKVNETDTKTNDKSSNSQRLHTGVESGFMAPAAQVSQGGVLMRLSCLPV